MGQPQSKGERLYHQVNYGNIEGIKSLCTEGAGFEWIDKEGKTPLIVACLNPRLHNVAKTLIELGANVNAYRPGRNAGTPLHHVAKTGHENILKLLLSHGANPLIMNDDCRTPLELARSKGHSNVVRTIESHICLFSGWMREFYGPGFLEVLAPLLLSRKVWVVILPCGSRNPTKPFKLELAIYTSLQDAQPRNIIWLWKANLEEPKFHGDPSVSIVHANISRGRRGRRHACITSEGVRCRRQDLRKNRIKLASANEGDKRQLQWFCDACKGITRETSPAFLNNAPIPAFQATAPPAEDLELAMALNASIQSTITELPSFDAHSGTEASTSTSCINSSANSSSQKVNTSQDNLNAAGDIQTSSAPPIMDEISEDGRVLYPSIDSSPFDLSFPALNNIPSKSEGKEAGNSSSSCPICLDAPVEGACIPCGHMAGCMSCLKEIQAKKWGCPVCRTRIEQVVRLYAV